MAQAVRIVRIVQVMRELPGFTIQFVEPSHRTHPDRPVPGFYHRVDVIIFVRQGTGKVLYISTFGYFFR